ncbi:MAG: SufE family protein [Arenimonas sp.]|jgi:cysteine desulfuration protein SufE|uniref:SufE family protein n=1 Tax=Arenimonas sp. TaxID=1872635 RepID=UPI001B544BF4|nr:SufE family protein [Arenimonas sp.]
MLLPTEASAAEAQQAIVEDFAFFGDWSERYQYLIDLGKRLPDFPEAWKTESNRLMGCQSKVWIVPHRQDDKLFFSAASDSSIVSGLVYLALRVYSGRTAEQIRATRADFVQAIGLSKHLSPTRSNGFSALLTFIQKTAESL